MSTQPPTANSHNARQMLSAQPLAVTEIAEILRRTAMPDGQFHPDVVRMAQEIERLQWDLNGWRGRCEMAREERDELTDQLYQVRAELPRKAGKI